MTEQTKKWLLRTYDNLVNNIILFVLLLIIAYGGYSLMDAWMVYQDTAKVQEELLMYKPDPEEETHPTLDELIKINSDVCAWITLEGTHIDTPVLQGEDNMKYVNTNVYGEYAISGSVFMDFRNSREFTDPYTVTYGHHMEEGAMFGDLDLYEKESFFNQHTTGWLMIPKATYELEIFAYLKTIAFDSQVYTPVLESEGKDCMELIDYIKDKAMYYRDVDIQPGDCILGLTTCASESTDGRRVVYAKLIRK